MTRSTDQKMADGNEIPVSERIELSRVDNAFLRAALASQDWTKISEVVLAQCRSQLGRYGVVDPEEVCQDVMATLLRRDFGKRFDPEKGDFRRYLGGVVLKTCCQTLRRAIRRSARTESYSEGVNCHENQ